MSTSISVESLLWFSEQGKASCSLVTSAFSHICTISLFASLIEILSLLQRYDRCEADADDPQQPRDDDIVRGNAPPNLDDVVGINSYYQQPREDRKSVV